MASVTTNDENLVSEVTLQARSSLHGGSLYPPNVMADTNSGETEHPADESSKEDVDGMKVVVTPVGKVEAAAAEQKILENLTGKKKENAKPPSILTGAQTLKEESSEEEPHSTKVAVARSGKSEAEATEMAVLDNLNDKKKPDTKPGSSNQVGLKEGPSEEFDIMQVLIAREREAKSEAAATDMAVLDNLNDKKKPDTKPGSSNQVGLKEGPSEEFDIMQVLVAREREARTSDDKKDLGPQDQSKGEPRKRNGGNKDPALLPACESESNQGEQVGPTPSSESAETPELRRNPPVSINSTPGAYAQGLVDDPFAEGTEQGDQSGYGPGTEASTTAAMRNLIVAAPVNEVDDEERQCAEQIDLADMEKRQQAIHAKQQRSRKKLLSLLGCLVLVPAVVVAVVSYVLSRDNDNEQDSSSSAPAPAEEGKINETSTAVSKISIEEHILSLLPETTVHEIVHSTKVSPRRSAYEWLVQDPNILDGNYYSDQRLLQRFVLATMFYSTGGMDSWISKDHWMSYATHECEWYNHYTHGFYEWPEIEYWMLYNSTDGTCPLYSNTTAQNDNSSDSIIEHLWLVSNELEGKIPEELYLLTSLKSISIDRNRLSGTLSTQIAKLSHLEALGIYNNKLTGPIPSEIGTLKNLSFLWAMSNALEGSLPTELGLLSDSLVYLLSDTNQLTGPLPSEIGHLSHVEWLWLWDNHLTGSLPTEMAQMNALGSCAIDVNDFTGTIPTEIGLMQALWKFHLQKTMVTGTIPTELGLCNRVYSLYLADSPIIGAIPSELGQMTELTNIQSMNMLLTGTLPSELGKLSLLYEARFQNNKLSGPIPTELGNLSSLIYLHLQNNTLSGSVPTQIGRWQQLSILDLSSNALTGQIPSEFGAFDDALSFWDDVDNTTRYYENATEIRLDNNNFTGSVPPNLGLLQDLAVLSIYNNSLTGTLPTSLCDLGAVEDPEEGGLMVDVDCERVECTCGVCNCV